MNNLEIAFKERLNEIDAYLDLLDGLEAEVRKGPPKLGTDGLKVSTLQVQILYSSVYLQLYNLVEATVSKFIDALCEAIAEKNRWRPSELSNEVRTEWVRYVMNADADMNYENRFKRAVTMCEHLIQALPVSEMEISRGGGGNWDDTTISEFSEKIGCVLNISPASKVAAKCHIRDEKGAMALVKKLRNDLAHGSVSFADCGYGVTVSEMKMLRNRTVQYLEEVVKSFEAFLDGHGFLQPTSRPTVVTSGS